MVVASTGEVWKQVATERVIGARRGASWGVGGGCGADWAFMCTSSAPISSKPSELSLPSLVLVEESLPLLDAVLTSAWVGAGPWEGDGAGSTMLGSCTGGACTSKKNPPGGGITL